MRFPAHGGSPELAGSPGIAMELSAARTPDGPSLDEGRGDRPASRAPGEPGPPVWSLRLLRARSEDDVRAGSAPDRARRAIDLLRRGIVRHERGRLQEARAALDAGLRVARAAGLWRIAGVFRYRLGWLALEENELVSASQLLRDGLALLREIGEPAFEVAALHALGCRYLLAGAGDRAGEYFRAALSAGRRVGDDLLEAHARAGMCAVAALAERIGEARAHLAAARRALGRSDRLRSGPSVVAVDLHEGWIELALTRTASGRRNREHARDLVAQVRERVRAAQAGSRAPASRSSHVRMAARLLECHLAHRARRQIGIDRSVSAIVLPGGRRVGLANRPSLQRVLARLVDARSRAAGQTVSCEELIAAGWPGALPVGQSGAQRVRTAIWTLRRLGLDEILLTRGDGYLIDPQVELVQQGPDVLIGL